MTITYISLVQTIRFLLFVVFMLTTKANGIIDKTQIEKAITKINIIHPLPASS